MDHEKSLQDIIFTMLCDSKYIFYGLFLAELNKTFDDKLPTACVGKHINSNNITLYLGKKWWEEVCHNDSRKKWTLIHELNVNLAPHTVMYV